ncbi:MAG: NADP-dependent isocitrate dehydrogenase [Proteobacteria bacterium]|nr:NADP-dependent isocitrate dehydrogenase [Pseudomonadota bacterium]
MPTYTKKLLSSLLLISPFTLFADNCDTPLNDTKNAEAATAISEKDGQLIIPDHPIIPYIAGDGIGPEIMQATIRVVNNAVKKAYGDKRSIEWKEIFAGMNALEKFGTPLPEATVEALKTYRVSIKGPTATPVGAGFRSVNVKMRQLLKLDSCVRPVSYHEGLASPVKHPEKVNMVIFRENTEDVYSGIEFAAESNEAKQLIDLILKLRPDADINELSAIGIKPMSQAATKTLMRRALKHAIDKKLPFVTIVHKGNIMKETEGAFLRWSLEVALNEFGSQVITESDVWAKYNGQVPDGKIVVKERIADAMFQEILLRPEKHNVLVAPNLNGDYLSDAVAALVGGLGIAPGANIGNNLALFEATHGTAPDIAGKNLANPSSTIKSAALMLEYLGWTEAKDVIEASLNEAFRNAFVTGDLREADNAQILGTAEFANKLIELQK